MPVKEYRRYGKRFFHQPKRGRRSVHSPGFVFRRSAARVRIPRVPTGRFSIQYLQKLLVVDSVPFTSIHVIDSHTAGEPTRVVVAGGPDLGRGSLADRARRLAAEQDAFRSAVVNEPRGSDVLVGALLCEPEARDSAAAVIFFNNVGYLGMCGHGTIGVVTTLAYQGRIGCGEHRIETPVGTVRATLHADGRVSIENVPAFRYRGDVTVDVPGIGPVTGEIAWGGNWFFLVENPPLPL